MPKKNKSNSNQNKSNTNISSDKEPSSKRIDGKYYPLVSVCTPTFNRRPFIPIMFQCFRNQTYPTSCIEWIIVDDGTDKIQDLIETSNISNIKYYSIDKKMSLGQKRNYMHEKAKGTIIIYMDDDDYYPPERIEHATETLLKNKDALCAGSSEIYIYFNHIKRMVQCGPYGPNHATAGTFAFRAELLKQTHYEDDAALAEEKFFLKNYTIPFVQLDPLKTILVFSHSHNTFDKKRLLTQMHPDFCKFSDKTIEQFIKQKEEEPIRNFFLNDMENILLKYSAGSPQFKPDVIENIKKMDNEREITMASINSNHMGGKIILNRPGDCPLEISPQQLIDIIKDREQHIQFLNTKLEEQQNIIIHLQNRIITSQQNTPMIQIKDD